jgi:hypothetical protein
MTNYNNNDVISETEYDLSQLPIVFEEDYKDIAVIQEGFIIEDMFKD